MKVEREHEAKNPGPEAAKLGPVALTMKLIIETINVTSANTNRQTILERGAHLQLLQEACLTKEQIEAMKFEANKDWQAVCWRTYGPGAC